MKKFLALVFVVAAAAAVSAGLTPAAVQHQAVITKTLVVAMHDPGCHSFLVHGKYLVRTSIYGPVRVFNHDEATLRVVSRAGTSRIAVGKSLVLRRGYYAITMVHQASDDNHLKLTVR